MTLGASPSVPSSLGRGRSSPREPEASLRLASEDGFTGRSGSYCMAIDEPTADTGGGVSPTVANRVSTSGRSRTSSWPTSIRQRRTNSWSSTATTRSNCRTERSRPARYSAVGRTERCVRLSCRGASDDLQPRRCRCGRTRGVQRPWGLAGDREDIGGSEGEQWVLLTPATRGHARGIQRRDGAPGRGRNRRFVPPRFCKQYRLASPV